MRGPEIWLFFYAAVVDNVCHTLRGGGAAWAKSRKCGGAAFLYLPHSAVVSHFETALSLRPQGRMSRMTRATPPQNRGVM